MKIFYHRDNDGRCSAAIVKHHMISMCRKTKESLEFFPINYGEAFPWDIITDKEEEVFMVDFGLQPFSDMLKLNDMCDLKWIDHHKSALAEHSKVGHIPIKGLREEGLAGCELTWMYLNGNNPIPEFVSLAGRYDVWDKKSDWGWDTNILPFFYGIMSQPEHMQDPAVYRNVWDTLMKERNYVLDGILPTLKDTGRIIRDYQEGKDAHAAEEGFFDVEINGLTLCACNASSGFNSRLFSKVFDPEIHDGMLGFGWMGKIGKWSCSIYCDDKKPDPRILETAKHFGGGGHPGACGFQCRDLPFELGKR